MGKIEIPGRKIGPGETPPYGLKKREDLIFYVGTIADVDPDRFTVDITFADGKEPLYGVKITQPYAGPSGYIAALPEKGAIVVVGKSPLHKLILTYLPDYVSGLDADTVKQWPSSVKVEDKNEYQYRFRKLMEGQIAVGSSKGAELVLDVDASLESFSNKILIRKDDKTILNTSMSNYVFSGGVWRSSGIVYRNSMTKEDNKNGQYVYLDPKVSGKNTYFLRPSGNEALDKYFSEYLLEVDDTTTYEMPVNDVNATKNRTIRMPIAVLAMGNMVGNNQGTKTYGKILSVRVFKGPYDTDGAFEFVPVSGDNYKSKAIAMALFKPERRNPELGAFFGIDKEGHFYQYIPSATGGGLGNGRSMSILAKGNKKETWGSDAARANSWDYVAEGGITWVIGTHNDKDNNPYKGKSWDLRTTSSVYFRYGTGISDKVFVIDDSNQLTKKEETNLTKYGKIEKISKNERVELEGTRETVIGGKEKISIDGMKQEAIGGAFSLSVGKDLNIGSSNSSEKVSKEKQESYGSRMTKISGGASELTMTGKKGDIKETILLNGNKSTKITQGDITETLISGKRVTTLTKGDYKLMVLKGNIKSETVAGDIALTTKKGTVKVGSLIGNIEFSTSPANNVSIKGGNIEIKGKTMVTAGVITAMTHKDYTTGAFLVGSKTVKASL